jgi:hypothetical protein
VFSLRRLFSSRPVWGALPDPPDSRDTLITSAGLPDKLPPAATVDRGQPPKSQGRSGSCVGQGVAEGFQLALLGLGRECPELSALFVYYNARRYHQRRRVTDNGTSVRFGIKAARRFGVCTERVWPMRVASKNRKPGWSAYRGAHDYHGIRNYYRIDRSDDLDNVRRAIANGLPVVAWWRIDKAFKGNTGATVIGPCDPNTYAGNHCMLIVSYYDNGDFGILNSWGSRWRHNGRQRVTAPFVRAGMDKWAIDVRP